MLDKTATTEFPILEVITKRWSPRAFADRPVEPEALCPLFEAARWAASSHNEQPWRFLVMTRDKPEGFDKALSCLVEANQAWAKAAPVLVLTAISIRYRRTGEDNRVALHDLGQAVAQLALEATSRGLSVHQMAGVDQDKVAEVFGLPDGFVAQTCIAIGYPGAPSDLPEGWTRDAETATRRRNPFNEFVFGDNWGKPSDLF